MAALASPADVEARLGRPFTPVEEARIDALLEDASAIIRAYTGQSFERVDDDVVVLRAVGGRLTLPQRPVIEVTRVEAVGGGEGLPDFALTDWTFDGIDTIRLGDGAVIINLPEAWWDEDGYPGTYRVTYSHGWEQVPGDVLAVVCAMATRALANPNNLRSETVGSYSVTYAVPATGDQLGLNLTRYERSTLDRYRNKAATVKVVR